MHNPRYQQREKTIHVHAPCCGAPIPVMFDGTGSGWERSTEIGHYCPKGHTLSWEVIDALHSFVEDRAVAGVGDFDPAELCGYTEGRR